MHAPLYPDREMGRAGAPAVNVLHPEKSRRIDAMVDPLLGTAEATLANEASAAKGRVAIAGAKAAYRHYLDLVVSPRFKALASGSY